MLLFERVAHAGSVTAVIGAVLVAVDFLPTAAGELLFLRSPLRFDVLMVV